MKWSNSPQQRTLRPDSFETDDGKTTGNLMSPFMRDVGNVVGGGIEWQNMRCVEREWTITMPSPWVTMTLANSWVAEATYSVPAYSKDGNTVKLRGAADSGTFGALAITTLPSSCWPPAVKSVPAVQSNATFTPSGRIDISTAGVVTAPDIPSIQTGVATLLGFDGISFDTANATPLVIAPFPSLVSLGRLGSPARAVLVVSCYDVTDRSSEPWLLPQIAWESLVYSGVPMLSISQAVGLLEGRSYRVGLKIFA